MCGVDKVYRHLLERIKRQYGYVQDVPRHPTDVVQVRETDIVQAFIDFRTHTIKQDSWGNPAGEMPWWMEDGYMLWYTRVSHPQILPPTLGSPPRPANEEQIITHQWEQHQTRGSFDTFDMVSGVVAYVDEHLGQKVMSPEQFYAALRHVKEQIAPVLTRRRVWSREGSNMSMSMSRTRSSVMLLNLGLVPFRLY